ncbi:flagellar basal body-associated FliL family protein [Cellvibrio sp. KY-GH-1]|uniref:flagellar basal body-associated FliL family protein n=1 Tax=Cellvibrio sp. KY-GH-1 TaxID=2303332 RepID=UPI001CD9C354|nr:flagellar basal body-associated FliL family protein [Cellvibrio sp. KY-GH-1]
MMQRIILALLVVNTLVAAGSAYISFQVLSRPQVSSVPVAADGSVENSSSVATSGEAEEYTFFPIEKVIVSLQGEGREHYFVLDLVLQAEQDTDNKKLKQIDPVVRNSVVAHLSLMNFNTLRAMPIAELQSSLEKVVQADFASRQIVQPFAHVLVSKLVVQ